MDVMKVLTAHNGVARRRDLVTAGVSGGQLTRAAASGRVGKPARGVFALPEAEKALVAATCAGAELACISAAAPLGLWVLRKPSLVHVTVDHGRALQKGFRVHRASKPLTPLDVCAQSMRCLPELDALCIVESAVVLGLVSLRGLRDKATGLRDADLRRIIDQVNPHSQSIIETVARYHLRQAGLSVQVQVYIPGVGRLDLVAQALGTEFPIDQGPSVGMSRQSR